MMRTNQNVLMRLFCLVGGVVAINIVYAIDIILDFQILFRYSVPSEKIPIVQIRIIQNLPNNLIFWLSTQSSNTVRNARWVKFFPKVAFCDTSRKVGERLAYWPIVALLFVIFLTFLWCKSLKIAVIFTRNKFQRFFEYR